MSRRHELDLRKLPSGQRAIISTEGLYRLQFMPSGRIYEELVAPSTAKTVCKAYNGCFRKNTIHTDRMVAISYAKIFAANTELMNQGKRRKSRKARKGGCQL